MVWKEVHTLFDQKRMKLELRRAGQGNKDKDTSHEKNFPCGHYDRNELLPLLIKHVVTWLKPRKTNRWYWTHKKTLSDKTERHGQQKAINTAFADKIKWVNFSRVTSKESAFSPFSHLTSPSETDSGNPGVWTTWTSLAVNENWSMWVKNIDHIILRPFPNAI